MWTVVTSYGKHWEDMTPGQREEVRKDNPGVSDEYLSVFAYKQNNFAFGTCPTWPAPSF